MNFEEIEQLVLKWAKDRSLLSESNAKVQAIKLREELNELDSALDIGHSMDSKDAIGDMIVVLTIIAHLLGSDLTKCYALAFSEIKNRTGKMVNGIFVKD